MGIKGATEIPLANGNSSALLGCIVVSVQAALEMICLMPWEMPSGASPLPVSLSITAMEDMTIMEVHLHGN